MRLALIPSIKLYTKIALYRYQMVILNPILIPFALKCKETRPGTIVQEDNALAHSSPYQQEVFDRAKGPITSKEALKASWLKLWKEMP
jgi:hypothetical protein